MQVDGRAAVRVGNFLIVDFAKPVVGGNRAAVAQDQAAHGIGDGGVFLHTPVAGIQVAVHQILIVEHGGLDVAHLFTLLAVQNIGLGYVGIAGLAEYALHAVLNILYTDDAILDLGRKVAGDLQRQQIDDGRVEFALFGFKGLGEILAMSNSAMVPSRFITLYMNALLMVCIIFS